MCPDFLMFRDEEGYWCAATPGFQNIILDPTGRGHTPHEAVEALKRNPRFQERAREFGWPTPTLEDFVHISNSPTCVGDVPGRLQERVGHRRQRFKLISR
jgi:hypothetical protein